MFFCFVLSFVILNMLFPPGGGEGLDPGMQCETFKSSAAWDKHHLHVEMIDGMPFTFKCEIIWQVTKYWDTLFFTSYFVNIKSNEIYIMFCIRYYLDV